MRLAIRNFIRLYGDLIAVIGYIVTPILALFGTVALTQIYSLWAIPAIIVAYYLGHIIIRILGAFAWSESEEHWRDWQYTAHYSWNYTPRKATRAIAWVWPTVLLSLPIYFICWSMIASVHFINTGIESKIESIVRKPKPVKTLEDVEYQAHQKLLQADPEFVRELEKAS